MNEKIFENKIKKFLKESDCYFLKYWGGGVFTRAGVPDILACCNGYFLGIEVKATQGKPSRLQLHHIEEINAAGGFAMVLYPDQFELFKNLILQLKADYIPYAIDSLNQINKKVVT